MVIDEAQREIPHDDPLIVGVLSELRELLDGIGDGGQIGPSVYDTAQLVLQAPSLVDADALCAWLQAGQARDGAWGDTGHGVHRLVPTLAAMLALHAAGTGGRYRAAVTGGRDFLEAQGTCWEARTPGDCLPIGMELILPALCAQARAADLALAFEPPPALAAQGALRRDALRAVRLDAGHPGLHCWEAWGTGAASSIVGPDGSVALSPSASAAWLAAACDGGVEGNNDKTSRDRTTRYLRTATARTYGAPGTAPCFWPLDVFEAAYVLFTLAAGGLHQHPALTHAVGRAASWLRAKVSEVGAGFSAGMAADGDTTAVAMVALRQTGHTPARDPLRNFVHEGRFVTFAGARHVALSTTIHGTHALRLHGGAFEAEAARLIGLRDVDGLWPADKWHLSWLCPTAHAVLALGAHLGEAQADATRDAILTRQGPGGGWGCHGVETLEETAYAILALEALERRSAMRSTKWRSRAAKACRWMEGVDARWGRSAQARPALWVGKQLYRPERVVRAVELTGLWVARRAAAFPP